MLGGVAAIVIILCVTVRVFKIIKMMEELEKHTMGRRIQPCIKMHTVMCSLYFICKQ